MRDCEEKNSFVGEGQKSINHEFRMSLVFKFKSQTHYLVKFIFVSSRNEVYSSM